jgi:hypothetical protein
MGPFWDCEMIGDYFHIFTLHRAPPPSAPSPSFAGPLRARTLSPNRGLSTRARPQRPAQASDTLFGRSAPVHLPARAKMSNAGAGADAADVVNMLEDEDGAPAPLRRSTRVRNPVQYA